MSQGCLGGSLRLMVSGQGAAEARHLGPRISPRGERCPLASSSDWAAVGRWVSGLDVLLSPQAMHTGRVKC